MVPARAEHGVPRRAGGLIAGFMDIKPEEKQAIARDLRSGQARLDEVLELLAHRIEVLRLSREIDERTKASMDDRQREIMLREQMQSIQKELGEGEGRRQRKSTSSSERSPRRTCRKKWKSRRARN